MKTNIILLALLITYIKTWWEVGHMLVSQIAENELMKNNIEVYNEACKLVKSMGELAEDNTFVGAAVWPDQIKDEAMNFLDSWHFYDRPYNPDGMYLQQDQTPKELNSINCLERARKALSKNYGKVSFSKAMFIRYLLHVVGDIHQPLHSSVKFNSTYTSPLGDMGGNKIKIITLDGENSDLHSFWDQGGQYFQTPTEEMLPPLSNQHKNYIQELALEITDEMPKKNFGGLPYNLNFTEWSKESYYFTVNTTYPLLQYTNKIDLEYQFSAIQLCKQRVALAGYRVAELLIDILQDSQINNPIQ